MLTSCNDNDEFVRSGAVMLAAWNCHTREEKLERACIALTRTLRDLHLEHKHQDLNNQTLFCACSDAYKMGMEALK